MPSAASPNPRAGSAGRNESNNYDQDVDDFLRDLPVNNDNTNDTTQPTKDVDEEIKVKKKRAPVPKLDEARLLSDAGVPKLRKITKTRLKFKGKGHEFSDISRLLNTCQLWLDDLYPRAKFRDALTMVEKVGHSKRMQVTRRAWIDATKPSRREESPERLEDMETSGALPREGLGREGSDAEDLFGENADEQQRGRNTEKGAQSNDMPEDDELDALMAENAPATTGAQDGQQQKRRAPFEEDDDGPDEDELDALMAENEPTAPRAAQSKPQQQRGPFEEDDAGPDEDELDALMAEEQGSSGGTNAATTQVAGQSSRQEQRDGDDFADEEEAMASMGW